MRKLYALLAALSLTLSLTGQTARVQVIHNSPSPTVDVYANGALLLDDFVFRTATSFIDLPAGVEIDLAVALANSTSVADALVTFEDIVLENGKTYVIAAGGIVGDADFPFTLQVTDEGLESASAGTTEVNVLHGAPGAPAVDVTVRGGGDLVSNLSYGNYSGYAGVPADLYYLDVKAAGSSTVVATFEANLSSLGGQAITVFASGILGGDPAFGLFAALADGTVVELPQAFFARAQVIHNSPSPTVDVYANGALLLDDLVFRTATSFIDLPAGVEIDLAVALANSTSVADALVTFEDIVLENGKTYVIAAGGIVGDTDFPFTLQVTDEGLESAGAGTTEVNVLHGAPGAPAVDVTVRGGGDLVSNLSYGNYSGYAGVPADLYYLDVKAAGSSTVVATFEANLSSLGGQAITVFASGILGGDPAFGLFAALADGTVVALTPVSRLQIIHNSPEPTVDIYIDGNLAVDDLAFRDATPFIDIETRIPYEIAVAPANSQSVADAIATFDDVTFEDGKAYVVFATGVVGSAATPFDLRIFDQARERSETDGNVDILLYHGAPDAPQVDVVAVGAGVIFDNVSYGEFSADYVSVPAATYTLNVTPAADNSTIVRSYTAPLEGLADGAAVAFATGFLADEPAFGVWVALPDGTTFPLSEVVASKEVLALVEAFQIMPNPVSDLAQIDLAFSNTANNVSLVISDATGKTLQTQVLGNQFAGAQRISLDVSTLAQGLHFCTIITKKGVLTKRFVVAR